MDRCVRSIHLYKHFIFIALTMRLSANTPFAIRGSIVPDVSVASWPYGNCLPFRVCPLRPTLCGIKCRACPESSFDPKDRSKSRNLISVPLTRCEEEVLSSGGPQDEPRKSELTVNGGLHGRSSLRGQRKLCPQ